MKQEILAKYDQAVPRYTSYPSALFFQDGIDEETVEAALASTAGKPISLYLHLPFCRSLCWYCGCHKVITKDTTKIDAYLDSLNIELKNVSQKIADRPKVAQLHFGGGSPSYLDQQQMTRCFEMIGKYFDLQSDGEYSIEGDPREMNLEHLGWLSSLGFNRLSLGVQDFNQEVQVAINRVQSAEHSLELIREAPALGFNSVSVDLIYGLP